MNNFYWPEYSDFESLSDFVACMIKRILELKAESRNMNILNISW